MALYHTRCHVMWSRGLLSYSLGLLCQVLILELDIIFRSIVIIVKVYRSIKSRIVTFPVTDKVTKKARAVL